ncbi:centromere/kinetochore protein zw10 [Culicoides brevitarsis]|uniref:centromere/kinetochore protein zw10 n=1 Tax=Culicoides brevitarsis TaxID=469753 RepID=UPI00307B9F2C
MSFIRRVINAVHETEITDARQQIAILNSEIKSYQQKGRKCIENKYKNFLPDVGENERFMLEGENLVHDVKTFLEHLENNVKHNESQCKDDVECMVKSLEESALGLTTCIKLVQIENLLNEIHKINKLNRFNDATNVLAELKMLIYDDESNDIIRHLDCYKNIKIHYIQEYETFLCNLHQNFESLVEFKSKTFQNTKAISIRISKDMEQLRDTTVALVNTNYCPITMCDFLLENVFEPICTRSCTLNLDDTDCTTVKLLLSYNLNENNGYPDYRVVFNNVKKVFKCLSYMNVIIDNDRSVFSIIAQNIKDNFFDLIINKCISLAIPKSISEMKSSTIIEDMKRIHNFLCDVQFLNNEKQEDLRLITAIDKVIILFSKKYASNTLDEAKIIMHKDLHDTKTVESTFTIESTLTKCQISKSTFQLIKLLETVIENAKEFEENSEQVLNTVLMVLERYGQEVCEYHNKLLESVPQQSAIFRNNCHFIAEWGITHNSLKCLQSFENVTQFLYHLGDEKFKSQLYTQIRNLRIILEKLDFSEFSQISPGPHRLLRQCLRQMEVLKNVWHPILPSMVYKESMSLLLNELCEKVIHKIVKMEDITAKLCNELEDIILLIEKKGPGLFDDDSRVEIEVKLWMKLMQLKTILSASLAEISELWCGGKGTLAANFKAEEIKHLIRALFQNTDRRATVIASIL